MHDLLQYPVGPFYAACMYGFRKVQSALPNIAHTNFYYEAFVIRMRLAQPKYSEHT